MPKAIRKSKNGSRETLFKRIKRCVDKKVRPYIELHGGGIELIGLTGKNILKVRLHGACVGCALASSTLQYGVQNMLDEDFPKENIRLEPVE